MLFDEALQYLLSLGHETLAIKLGLANTERLLEAVGQPQKAFRKVQIAGTNGKGSTAVMLDAMTRAAGIKTALYTSPHLVSITERLRFDGREIQPESFADLTARVREAANALLAAGAIQALPTFFEHLTVMFLLACVDARTELAILETGLGGRLDATTAAGAEVVAITSIALDHQEYLGETLPEIAAEKAAIIRRGVTAIVSPQPPEALAVIERRGAECEVRLRQSDCAPTLQGASRDGRLRVTFESGQDRYEDVLLGLRGGHQVTNACIAIQLAEALRESGFVISRADIIAGLHSARHAGRLEIYEESPRILFDGAHNIAGAQALRDYLDEFVSHPVTLVFGAMRDKDLKEIAAILFPVARRLILTQPSSPRAATPEMLAQVVPPDAAATITAAPDLREALRIALTETTREGLVCVTGSLYLVGEAQSILGAR
ncbi:MAG TPA: folylpolyglutamate synthase/dihydrofolate synthase family protein [Pyrinomonadaceae bacterium]|jgi:dihydrofolate synthase/folylpolyglutamate synthase